LLHDVRIIFVSVEENSVFILVSPSLESMSHLQSNTITALGNYCMDIATANFDSVIVNFWFFAVFQSPMYSEICPTDY